MLIADSIRIALVEDEPGHARELQRVLSPEAGFDFAASCNSAEDALRTLPGTSADVVLMDVYMGGMSGIECIWHLKDSEPLVPIIVCTSLESEDLVAEAIMAGASGYILKHDSPEEIRTVVRNVANGCFGMTRSVARDLRQFFQAVEPDADETVRLSSREKETLKEMAHGYMDAEIIEHMGIKMPTLRTYITSIYKKLHIGTRTEAAAKYWRSREGRFHRLSELVQELGNKKKGTFRQ